MNELNINLAKLNKVVNLKSFNDKLHRIYFDADSQNFVATDGHIMVWQTVPNIFGEKSFLIERDNFEKLQKASTGKNPSFVSIIENTLVIESNGTKQILPITFKDSENWFPNWGGVIPSEDQRTEVDLIGFNPSLLKTVISDIHPNKTPGYISMYFHGKSTATIIEFKDCDYKALIMPINLLH